MGPCVNQYGAASVAGGPMTARGVTCVLLTTQLRLELGCVASPAQKACPRDPRLEACPLNLIFIGPRKALGFRVSGCPLQSLRAWRFMLGYCLTCTWSNMHVVYICVLQSSSGGKGRVRVSWRPQQPPRGWKGMVRVSICPLQPPSGWTGRLRVSWNPLQPLGG